MNGGATVGKPRKRYFAAVRLPGGQEVSRRISRNGHGGVRTDDYDMDVLVSPRPPSHPKATCEPSGENVGLASMPGYEVSIATRAAGAPLRLAAGTARVRRHERCRGDCRHDHSHDGPSTAIVSRGGGGCWNQSVCDVELRIGDRTEPLLRVLVQTADEQTAEAGGR